MAVKRSGQPAYAQLADDLRKQMREGSLAVGSEIPSTSQLMSQYEVSNTVVKRALDLLKAEGLLIGQQGKGVFVRELPAAPEPSAVDVAAVMRRLDDLGATVEQLVDRIAALEKGRSTSAQPRPARES
ncbi:GntR family transcriptional regulator [Streptomyces sp. NBC_01594]|uniref:GntR family transcriptional regulator n=1 Tax=Streptomyces sp. NBC_01594 TaxID=2975890 RepID=UPI00386FAB76